MNLKIVQTAATTDNNNNNNNNVQMKITEISASKIEKVKVKGKENSC